MENQNFFIILVLTILNTITADEQSPDLANMVTSLKQLDIRKDLVNCHLAMASSSLQITKKLEADEAKCLEDESSNNIQLKKEFLNKLDSIMRNSNDSTHSPCMNPRMDIAQRLECIITEVTADALENRDLHSLFTSNLHSLRIKKSEIAQEANKCRYLAKRIAENESEKAVENLSQCLFNAENIPELENTDDAKAIVLKKYPEYIVTEQGFPDVEVQ